jgi:hypothetical protein
MVYSFFQAVHCGMFRSNVKPFQRSVDEYGAVHNLYCSLGYLHVQAQFFCLLEPEMKLYIKIFPFISL